MRDDWLTPFGKAKVERPGKDISIVTFSRAVGKCLDAAERLAQQGISAEVINLRSIRPLDREAIINTVKKTNHLVTVEEGWPQYGVGSEIAAVIMECKRTQAVLFLLFAACWLLDDAVGGCGRCSGRHQAVSLCFWRFLAAEAFDYLDAPVERITGVDVPMPYALNLENKAVPQVRHLLYCLVD